MDLMNDCKPISKYLTDNRFFGTLLEEKSWYSGL